MLQEIQNIKNQNLVCLDFDDCIIAWNSYAVGVKKWENNSIEKILEILQYNVNLIKEFCDKYGFRVFVTSSWSGIIQNDLTLLPEGSDAIMEQLWSIIKTLPIIGKDPFNDRILAMEVLIDNGNNIVCVDDFDLEKHFEWAGNKFHMINILNGERLKEKLQNLTNSEKFAIMLKNNERT